MLKRTLTVAFVAALTLTACAGHDEAQTPVAATSAALEKYNAIVDDPSKRNEKLFGLWGTEHYLLDGGYQMNIDDKRATLTDDMSFNYVGEYKINGNALYFNGYADTSDGWGSSYLEPHEIFRFTIDLEKKKLISPTLLKVVKGREPSVVWDGGVFNKIEVESEGK
jgi:hypothetical protein